MKELNDKIIEWLKKHNIDKLSPDKQYLKILEEVGELARGLLKNDLELYKTPHERLLELGWIIDKDDTNPATLEFYYKNNKVLIIDKALKVIKTLYGIDLELAEILVDYLKELENE